MTVEYDFTRSERNNTDQVRPAISRDAVNDRLRISDEVRESALVDADRFEFAFRLAIGLTVTLSALSAAAWLLSGL